MELSWSTFLLEIINFLVLVWILKRFLFKPVRGIIARRRAEIDQDLHEAQTRQTEAEALKQQYQARLSDWEAEKRQLKQTLAQELESEKARRLNELRAQIETERKRNQVADARREADLQRSLEETALRQGARFAGRLLQEGAGVETERRLVNLVCEALERLPEAERVSFQHLPERQEAILVCSAFPLSVPQRQRLTATLSTLFPGEPPIHFEQEASLLAGLRIVSGNWVLGCNLRDELADFAALDHER